MKEFFIGWHQPVNGRSGCGRFDRCMISINRLLNRKSNFPVRRWIMDSGAFTRISTGVGHLSVEQYAEQIDLWSSNGDLAAAVSQDYMCEPFVLEKTGLTVEDHQELTIVKYDELMAQSPKTYIMPVLQGFTPEEYVRHLSAYGKRLKTGQWVGVGSVCKRNGKPGSVFSVLLAIYTARPDLRLHGFGLKKKALARPEIWDLLYSADSAAATLSKGSGSNKYVGNNDPETAIDYAKSIAEPVQLSLWRTQSK